MAHLVHNERVKMGATFFNNVGVAALVAGAIIPAISREPAPSPYLTFGLGFVFAVLFYLGAQWMLSSLREE